MNTKDLVNLVSRKTLTHKQAKEIVDYVFDLIKINLKKGEKIVISGLGTFEIKETKGRKGRNPKTGIEMKIPDRKLLKFKVSKKFYE